MQTKKLYTRYDEKNDIEKFRVFEMINEVPKVGDYWKGLGFEVVSVEGVKLDEIANNHAYGESYMAYKVSYINKGFEEEREDPFVDYVAIVR